MTDFPFWVLVKDGETVYDAILRGDWYSSEMAANATKDQFEFELGASYRVFGANLKESND
jgi:hypothetical protein